MPSLPTGTVTFLFTDIEGSTHLLQDLGDRYAKVLADYRQILRSVSQKGNGREVDTQGDAALIAFARARDALAAAVESQHALIRHSWPEEAAVRVRMGLHTGEPLSAETGYVGMALHRAARISHAGHGGQILLSDATRALVEEDLPGNVTLKDLGTYRLQDLSHPQHLFQVVARDLPVDFPPLRSLDVVPNNLPLQLTTFVGRGHEMAEVKRLLKSTRLLTLTGAGGCGKTRLALQGAADQLAQYPDGVRLVDLAPLSDPTLIPQSVASTLGIRGEPNRPLTETLADFLRSKTLLLLLDNCEHLLSACAQLADALLRPCPSLRILATSREALGIAGETTYRVPSLSLPQVTSLPMKGLTQYEAVRLFIDRATSALPTFKVTAKNAQTVATICQRLDGIPLAIELAAVRVKALSVEHIADRLEDRFKLLTEGSRTAIPRHQTLRATLDWSFALLSEPERVVLRRLSLFAGGFTLEAAEAVCPGHDLDATDVLDTLTHLVDKSLVVFQEYEGRYRLLETVRQYGRDRLLDTQEAAALRTRYRDFFLNVAEEAEHHFRSAEGITWLDSMETEHDNLRAALAWSLESGDAEAALRIAGALWWFWLVRGHWSEGRGWLERALIEAKVASSPARASALYGAGGLAYYERDYEHAAALAEESLTLCRELGDKYGIGLSCLILGSIARDRGEYERPIALYEEALASFRNVGRATWGVAEALWGVASVVQRDDYERAAALFEESLGFFREVGDKWGIEVALVSRGNVAVLQGDYNRATELFTECQTAARELGENWGIASSLRGLGTVARLQGDYGRARTLIGESLTISRRLGDRSATAYSLGELGLVALDQGEKGQAVVFFQEGAALRQEIGTKPSIAAKLRYTGLVAQAQGDYEKAKAHLEESLTLYREARNKPGIAASLSILGKVARQKGDYHQAAELYKERLRMQRDLKGKLDIAECLEGLAVAAGVRKCSDRAARLFAATETLRRTIGPPLPPVDRADYDRNVDAVRTALGEDKYSAALAAGRAMTLEQAFEYALKDDS